MDNSIANRIKERIHEAEDGTVFVSADFSDIADNNTIRQNLFRLVNDGILERIINGVYQKPKYSDLLHENVAINPDDVARAIARSYHWTIAPSGNTALNLIGLSTQVSANWSYISDGPYKEYRWDNVILDFKHRTNKEISGLSDSTVLLVQALKTLGKDNITKDTIDYLKEKLTEDEKTAALKEASESTSWIYKYIKQICESETGENR